MKTVGFPARTLRHWSLHPHQKPNDGNALSELRKEDSETVREIYTQEAERKQNSGL